MSAPQPITESWPRCPARLQEGDKISSGQMGLIGARIIWATWTERCCWRCPLTSPRSMWQVRARSIITDALTEVLAAPCE